MDFNKKKNIYNKINEKYGYCGSWAVWNLNYERPKDNMDDLTIFENDEIINDLNFKYIIVGLNISKEIKIKLSNFHGKNGDVYKLRYGIQDSKLYGSYMTDIIKYHVDAKSTNVIKDLKNNEDIMLKNINIFKQEIKDLEIEEPILISLGNGVDKILNKYLKEYKIIKIKHYAAFINKENYRKEIMDIIQE
jgi:hypothetical protein